MKSFYRFFMVVMIVFFVFSCGGAPEPQPSAKPRDVPVQAEPAPVEESKSVEAVEEFFDPNSITKEEFDTAKTEVQQLIQKLNGIIRAKNYTGWVSYLDRDYFRLISSKEYLDQINGKANLDLRDTRDYFNRVVVPSRANDRVDDIEYISRNRVKAFTISPKGERLRLYDLEKTDEGWRIIN
jgi:hypothetical protein